MTVDSKEISVIIEKLSKEFKFSDRTTLNRMRAKPDAFKF
jgi:hypothetical protein